MQTSPVPTVLGGWNIRKLIGEGACGMVFEATKGDLRGAIKIFRNERKLKAREFDRANLLANESNLLYHTQKFHIPYLPQLYQVFSTEGEWSYMVIELFPKGSLVDFVRDMSFTRECVFGIGYRLVKCLQLIHTVAEWYHLDLKPENVMIRENKQIGISLIDFGVSYTRRFTQLVPRKALQGSYPFLGSFVWRLEPESPRDDLEAVGFIIAWLLLGGELPWSKAENLEEMKHHITDPNLPQTLGRLCGSKCLEEFLCSVRRLRGDETPEYDQLLSILEHAAGEKCVYELDWTLNETLSKGPRS